MLAVDGAVKRFAEIVALDGVDLTVADGQILGLLGPSGCGKTTLLRLIAGLERADKGRVLWDGEDLAPVPVHQRRFGVLFQSYALFPHLSVGENVAFGLRMDRRSPAEIDQRVGEVLDWVGLSGFESRRITGLSGGEQQRVALARSLAPSPRLVMLDEPIGALDRGLRRRLIEEMRLLLKARRITTIYVTHDQTEVAAVADRIALMRAGRIIQTGALEEIRSRPADAWVAEFVSD